MRTYQLIHIQYIYLMYKLLNEKYKEFPYSSSYECRAFLGSPGVLSDTRFFIPYVVMEWTFAPKVNGTMVYSESCPKSGVRNLTSLFVKNGYHPYNTWVVRGNPVQNLTWFGDVVWIHKNAKPVTLK